MELQTNSSSLEKFRSAVLRSERLQAKLRLAATPNDVISLASEIGFSIDVRQLEALARAVPVALTEPELDSVAGAAPCWCDPSVVDSKSCG